MMLLYFIPAVIIGLVVAVFYPPARASLLHGYAVLFLLELYFWVDSGGMRSAEGIGFGIIFLLFAPLPMGACFLGFFAGRKSEAARSLTLLGDRFAK
jgi:hypothetical protein